jgi:thiaminase
MRNATTEEERVKIEQEWKDTIDSAEQQVQELEETVQSSWVDSLTTAAEAFRTSVDLAAEAFEDAMTGIYGSFERL